MQSLAKGSILPSVTTKSLTLPRLDPQTADAAAQYLRHLADLQFQASYLLNRIDEAREALVRGLEIGATVSPDHQSSTDTQ